MTVILEIHGRNGNTGELLGLFRSIEIFVLWGSDSSRGTESPDETEILYDHTKKYQVTCCSCGNRRGI